MCIRDSSNDGTPNAMTESNTILDRHDTGHLSLLKLCHKFNFYSQDFNYLGSVAFKNSASALPFFWLFLSSRMALSHI